MPSRRRTDSHPGYPRRDPITEAIAQRAFELFLARGGEHGHDLADWLQAEREVAKAATSLPTAAKPPSGVRYEYDVDVNPLVGPIGQTYFFFAKVVEVVRVDESGKRSRIDAPVGECYGKNADEVRGKAEAAMQEWIDAKQKGGA